MRIEARANSFLYALYDSFVFELDSVRDWTVYVDELSAKESV